MKVSDPKRGLTHVHLGRDQEPLRKVFVQVTMRVQVECKQSDTINNVKAKIQDIDLFKFE